MSEKPTNDELAQRVKELEDKVFKLKLAEEELQKARDELEERVKERTAELEIKAQSLEEINTAMQVLLDKREQDKRELEGKVKFNIQEMVVPYLKKLRSSSLDERQRAYINIIDSNLNSIIAPFSRRFSKKYLQLSPSEIQVSNLIRQGRSTKEIAKMLQLSRKTIESHRKNIRMKIGIKNRKENLRTVLMSI